MTICYGSRMRRSDATTPPVSRVLRRPCATRATWIVAGILLATPLHAQTDAGGAAPPHHHDQSFSPAQPPTSTIEEHHQSAPSTGDHGADPLKPIDDWLNQLHSRTGLKLEAAYTTLFQQSVGTGEDRRAASGDLDLGLRWNLVGRGTKDPGTLVFYSEYRHQIGDRPPSALAGEIGAGIGTTNGFSERPMIVKELYWLQHAFDGVLRFGAGRAEPENLVGGHRLQSANTAFLNKAFSGNPAIAYPGAGFAAAAGIVPSDQWYVSAGVVNAYARSTTVEFESLIDNWDLFAFLEAGWTPTFDGLGSGRYRVALWSIDERDLTGRAESSDDRGVNFIIDQELGERWQIFARYAISDADATGVRGLFSGGAACKGLLGQRSLTGLAGAFADFKSSSRNDETIFEVFQRWQMLENAQFTLGAQLILSPADRPDNDAIGVLSARFRVSF